MTLLELDRALATDTEVYGPECECGCGEFLPPNSTRRYKRGHKNRSEGNYGGRPANAGPTYAEVADPQSDWITLADAASSTPNDPDPPEAKDNKPVVRVTKRVRDDIEGKVGMMLTMAAMLWSAKDPFCAQALTDNGPNIAAKMVPVICKSPELVRWFTKGGNYTAWLDLMMALWPVVMVGYKHHISHEIGNQNQPGKPNLTVVPNEAYKL